MSAQQFLNYLTAGSVWIRTDNGKQVKFLYLTNTTLKPKMQLKFPPQVIYADEQGDVFNRSIDDFASVYTFFNVDGELEKRLEGLLVFSAEAFETIDDTEDEDPVDLDAPEVLVEVPHPLEVAAATLEEIDQAGPVPETLAEQLAREYDEPAKERVMSMGFSLSTSHELNAPTLTVPELSDAAVLYSREPSPDMTSTFHRILFKLDQKVTIESLQEIWHPGSTANTVDFFTVSTAGGVEIHVWDAWVGIYPEYSADGLYAAVLIRSAESPIDVEEPTAPEQPPAPEVLTPVPNMLDLQEMLAAGMQGTSAPAAPGIMMNEAPVVDAEVAVGAPEATVPQVTYVPPVVTTTPLVFTVTPVNPVPTSA